MRWTIIGLLSLIVLITQTSCGQASFTGSSGGSNSNPPSTPPVVNNGPGTGTTPGPTTPVVPGVNGSVPGTPTTPPGGGSTSPNPLPGAPGSPGYNGAPGYQPIPGGNGQCTTPPCQQSGVPTPEYGPIGQVQQPTPNSVVFGKDQVMHLGNGNYPNTSCMDKVSAIPLSGSIYFFQFQVNQDNTSVNVNVANICGVDFGSSTLQLAQGSGKIGETIVPRGATTLGLPSYVLNRGVYNVYIYAGKGNGSDGPTWDIDDFIVGQVQVTANQSITPGLFGAY